MRWEAIHDTNFKDKLKCAGCSKELEPKQNDEPHFKCDFGFCIFGYCKSCGLQRGGKLISRPKGSLVCDNKHFMVMRFSPQGITNNVSGNDIKCNQCKKDIQHEQGFFQCKSRSHSAQYFCKKCGLKKGGVEVYRFRKSLKCEKNHDMEM